MDCSAALRTEFLVGSSPDAPAQTTLLHVKSNLGPLATDGFDCFGRIDRFYPREAVGKLRPCAARHAPRSDHHTPLRMTFGTGQDLSSQVVAIPMTSFGMLMNSPHSEFQKISPQKRASVYEYRVNSRVIANPTSSLRGPKED